MTGSVKRAQGVISGAEAAPAANRRRRLLIVDEGEGLWGAQQVILRLAPCLEARGFEQVLASPNGGPLARAWRESGRMHVAVPAPPTRSIRTRSGHVSPPKLARETVQTIVGAIRIARAARRVGADAILANNHWSHLQSVLAARLTRVPVLLHLHTQSKKDMLGRLRAVGVMAADRSVAVSDAVRASLPQLARGNVDVIRNGIDSDFYAPGESPSLRAEFTGDQNAAVILSLSRYESDKGLDELIIAVAMLPDHLGPAHLILAGGSRVDTGHAEYLKELADRLLGSRARFLGFRADTRDLLRAADVCVLPSHDEGLPLVVLEAQAVGCPIVASNAGGIPEVVEDEHTGLLFRVGDVRQLASQLERVLTDDSLRERLRRNGQRYVATSRTIETQADALTEVLFSALRRNARRQ